MTNYRQHRDKYIAELERQVAEKEEARKKADARAETAEARARTAEAEAEAPTYVARTESGQTLYSGKHEASAIAEARNHFWNTRPRQHVAVIDSRGDVVWNSRQHGGFRRPKLAQADASPT